MDFSMSLVGALVLLTIAPGADTAVVVRSATRQGLYFAVVTSVGICSGLFVHALLTGLGLSAVVLSTDWAYSALKVIGATYLIYLGASSIKSVVMAKPTSEQSNSTNATVVSKGTKIDALRQGFLSNVLNPKTLAFYLAFLPQFVDPSQGLLKQAIAIAALHFVIAMLWQSFIAWLATKGAQTQQGNSARWLELGCGVALMLIGVSLFIPFGNV